MDMENCILEMEAIMKVTGKITKCMVSENCIIRMVKSHMKDTGLKMSSMEKEEFSMIDQKKYWESSTITTLQI